MGSNTFGNLFRITTWGESHGKAIGVVIDGCPSGLEINVSEINEELNKRAPGKTPYTSPRKETDQAEILSGLFEGKTTGAPISLLIHNQDADSSKYEPIKEILRPGHANFTYLEKYGIFDYRGGGRASARETACRVAAGAIAKKFIAKSGIYVTAYIKQIGAAKAEIKDLNQIKDEVRKSPLFCPDKAATLEMIALIDQAIEEGDSLGAVVEFIALSVPPGLGDPVYEKLEANLAHAMMSLPASKGFEIGAGFQSVVMKGSEHNDLFTHQSDKVLTQTNHAGGTLGGISTGMPIVGRVAFKPASSIRKSQKTLTTSNEEAELMLPPGSRHDPCVGIRAVAVVEAMCALVLADAILMHRGSRL